LLLLFGKLLERKKQHITLKMDSDVRDRYRLIANIEALLGISTALNNSPSQLSISTALELRLKMSRPKSDPSFHNHTRTGDQLRENRMGGECGMHGEDEKCLQVLGKKS
jgi:hypothetical protein